MLVSRVLPDPPRLDALASSETISLFLDFDGTLVDLAERPDAISVAEGLHTRLEKLSDRLGGRLALVSGRAVPDLDRHIGQPKVARAGSHGLAMTMADGGPIGPEPAALAPDVVRLFRDFAASRKLLLEEKPHGLALHFRMAPLLEDEAADFARNLANEHGLEIKTGKSVVELVARGANKGAAVHAFMQLSPFAGSRPIFVGDDMTDEDGFSAAAGIGGFGVLVGERHPTAAAYRLADPAAVHEWLGL
ncbi:trehalose 6-phosphate phosphatase [Tsuneonella deserti]|uniref:Trehalose 6-phosphate phosphatase n=1 Tax=Tsuneonella deserti TaxID=2035528 RepID=A0ABQ1S3F6_9SPHN|nr:trehalose-phosphatase [Tsuneonella deserti]GGD89132.1 trehalose 6-phosphate phosphatase [Tsuneonella deserti]